MKQQIETALRAFSGSDLRTASIGLLNSLDYQSEKTLDLDNTPDAFLAEFDKRDRKFRKDKALFDRWKSVEFLFQITDDEVRNTGAQGTLFDSGYDHGNYQSYLFFALDLKKNHYTRTQLADITREINLLFDMSAMLLIRHNGALTFSIIDRRLHKKDQSRDVLEKVKLIKDIRYQDPHRAHIEILHDLSLQALMSKHECRDFKQLHEAWRTTLDTNELNKKFYRRIQEWFFWAAQVVRFPHGGIDDEDLRNRTALIRLLTRIVFCWFAREKGLVHNELFDAKTPARVLKQFDPDSETDGSYYLAFLQNLFFPTLSVPLDQREFRNGRRYRGVNKHYMKHEFFRHEALFKYSDDLGRLFADIPFLNGGLFECLDTGTRKKDEVRVDGFSDVVGNQPMVPNILFFGREVEVDLSESYDSSKKSEVKVDGLFHILNAYKFTVAENTPIEEEIALDPELLGRIFENLLAEYNPDTANTARKETGSFYTPRSIVDYMVDSSLKTYLKQILAEKRSMSEEDANVGLDILFSYTEKEHPFTESEKLTIVDAIHDIKILDPACGSGAFPLGMLQKLVYVLEKLDHGHERWKQRIIDETPAEMREETRELLNRSSSDHNWKLGLIQRCIYGIDIQPIAVQIAKLRCFIALLVDFEVNEKRKNKGVPALPNLDFKFVAADTLVKPPGIENYAQNLLGLTESDPFFGKFAEATESYFFIRDPAVKRKLRVRIEALINEKICENENSLAGHRGDSYASEAIRKAISNKNRAAIEQTEREILLWKSYRNIFAFHNQHVRFFDMRYFFPEANAGFDIVIGNPPYMRIQGIRQKDPVAADYYQTNYDAATGSFDLYVVFVQRGLELIKPSGVLNYIMPDKWVHAAFGKGLRKQVATDHLLYRLISLGAHKVFTACTYSSLLWLTRNPNSAIRYVRIDPRKEETVDLDHELRGLSDDKFTKIGYSGLSEKPWILTAGKSNQVMNRLLAIPRRLGQVFDIMFQGIASSKDSVYFLRDAKEAGQLVDAFSPELGTRVEIERALVKPLLLGDQVHRYEELMSSNMVVFPYEVPEGGNKPKLMSPASIQKRFPKGWVYLKECETVLRSRERGRFDNEEWYQFGRKQGIGHGSEPKLLAPDISLGGNFTFDREGTFYTTTTLYGYIKKPQVWERYEYWMALLNSTVLWFYLKNSGAVLANGYYRYKPAYLKDFPIPQCSENQEEVIVRLTSYVQFAKANSERNDRSDVIIAFLEKLIDGCILDVYFPEHMTENKLDLICPAASVALPLPEPDIAETCWAQMNSFFDQVNHPKHEIRNRLMRMAIDSPDFLGVIMEAKA